MQYIYMHEQEKPQIANPGEQQNPRRFKRTAYRALWTQKKKEVHGRGLRKCDPAGLVRDGGFYQEGNSGVGVLA